MIIVVDAIFCILGGVEMTENMMFLFPVCWIFGAIILGSCLIIAHGSTCIVKVKGKYYPRRIGTNIKLNIMIFATVMFSMSVLPLVIPIMAKTEEFDLGLNESLVVLAIITQGTIVLFGFLCYKLMGVVSKRKSRVLKKICKEMNAYHPQSRA